MQLRLFGDESRRLPGGGEFWLRFNLVGFEVARWQRAVAIGRGWIVVDHVYLRALKLAAQQFAKLQDLFHVHEGFGRCWFALRCI